jgi:AraC-like DNA-binding protein
MQNNKLNMEIVLIRLENTIERSINQNILDVFVDSEGRFFYKFCEKNGDRKTNHADSKTFLRLASDLGISPSHVKEYFNKFTSKKNL